MGKRLDGIEGLNGQKEVPARSIVFESTATSKLPGLRSNTLGWVGAKHDAGTDIWVERVFKSAPSHILEPRKSMRGWFGILSKM